MHLIVQYTSYVKLQYSVVFFKHAPKHFLMRGGAVKAPLQRYSLKREPHSSHQSEKEGHSCKHTCSLLPFSHQGFKPVLAAEIRHSSL